MKKYKAVYQVEIEINSYSEQDAIRLSLEPLSIHEIFCSANGSSTKVKVSFEKQK